MNKAAKKLYEAFKKYLGRYIETVKTDEAEGWVYAAIDYLEKTAEAIRKAERIEKKSKD